MSFLTKIINRLFSANTAPKQRALILGLDCAGKTTLLYRLATGEVVTTIPTIGFNIETVTLGTGSKHPPLQADCWDVGGCDKIRPLYRHYTEGADCIIFIVDSNDRERFQEAKEELAVIIGMPGRIGSVNPKAPFLM